MSKARCKNDESMAHAGHDTLRGNARSKGHGMPFGNTHIEHTIGECLGYYIHPGSRAGIACRDTRYGCRFAFLSMHSTSAIAEYFLIGGRRSFLPGGFGERFARDLSIGSNSVEGTACRSLACT
jgi:hypothetical protein